MEEAVAEFHKARDEYFVSYRNFLDKLEALLLVARGSAVKDEAVARIAEFGNTVGALRQQVLRVETALRQQAEGKSGTGSTEQVAELEGQGLAGASVVDSDKKSGRETESTEPSKPATEPSKPVTEPSKPVTEPSKPVTEPSKPVTEPQPEDQLLEEEPPADGDTTAVSSFYAFRYNQDEFLKLFQALPTAQHCNSSDSNSNNENGNNRNSGSNRNNNNSSSSSSSSN